MTEVVLSGAEGAAADSAASPTVQQASGSGDAPGARPGEAADGGGRSRLPGVLSHNDGEPWIERKPQAGDRARDEGGRYARPEEVEGAEGAEATKPELPENVEPPKQKFKFGGQEFESQEKAEQNFKSLQGMFRHKDTEIKTRTEERDYGYRAANAWEAKARQLEAQLQQMQGGPGAGTGQRSDGAQGHQAGSAPAGGLPELDTILNDIDTDAFEVLASQAGLPQAGKYLVSKTLEAVMQKVVPALRAEYDQKLEPFTSERAEQRQVAQADGVVRSLVEYRTPSGEQAFPELTDPVKVRQIGAMWAESGLPVEHAMTPAGLMQAVAMYRLVQSQSAPSVSVAPPPRPQREVVPNGGAAAAASVSGDMRVGVPGGNAAPSNMSPEHRRLIESLNSPHFVDRDLGFAKNARERSF